MMKFPARARYTLRLMVELAKRKAMTKPVNLAKISKLTGISKRYLEQLALALKSHSLLRGFAGRNGGYVLARNPAQITVGEILEAVAGPLEMASCVQDPNVCMSTEFCECRCFWVILEQRISHVMQEFTLADLVDPDLQTRIRLLAAEAEESKKSDAQPASAAAGEAGAAVVPLRCGSNGSDG
jgi:Rrf2 family protein